DADHTVGADPEPSVAQASRELLAELEPPRDVLEQDEVVARPVVLPEPELIHPRSPRPATTDTRRRPRRAARLRAPPPPRAAPPAPPPPRPSGSSGPAGRRRAAGARAPSCASPCPRPLRRA